MGFRRRLVFACVYRGCYSGRGFLGVEDFRARFLRRLFWIYRYLGFEVGLFFSFF